ncbi:TPA: sugar phosphate isomerase/epimerase [bacterium]|nr:sugar phosphate isomerase/epimerase [bacterium]
MLRWNMKTALHSVSYAGVWLGQITIPLEKFIQKSASLGYDAIMLVAKRPHVSLLDMTSKKLTEIRDLIEKNNLKLACMAGYTDFCVELDSPGIPLREMQIIYVTELARLAKDLGGNLVRIFTGFERENASYDQQWEWCVKSIKECAQRASEFDVIIGVQNHHDIAAEYQSMYDLLVDIDEPNCKAMFDAWSPALHDTDLVTAVKKLAPFIVHTTIADYVKRPRFKYVPKYINYERQIDAIRAVPMGKGFIDYKGFLRALKEVGYNGYVGYEMCSMLEGGGSEENLDRCAKAFVDYMKSI